ncbi:MAG: RAMP superfamily CRISPR-associated protein [Thermoanaerobaculia bacterium]
MPTLEIRLTGPLLVAGDASALGADLATARRFDGKRFVPYIPATALRGAVRLQLEALLRGAGEPAVGPYPLDTEGSVVDSKNTVARLFGYSGPKDERTGALEGQLRFGDAMPRDPAKAAAAIRVRPGLEIDDLTSTAADRKLFFREVAELGTDLLFHAPLALRNVCPEDERLLRAAIETTDALGAGKAKGGGALEIRWLDEGDPEEAGVEMTFVTGERADRARLVITLREPAHFGDGGPLGNHQATRTYIPGATVRGALAWALLNHEKTTGESPDFQALFLGSGAASFGDALPVDSPSEEPLVLAATRREERGTHATDDVLVRELGRERIARLLTESDSPLVLRADDGDRRFDPVPEARPARGLVRTTRTRVSIDRQTGAAADGRLFTIEQIEPLTTAGQPVRFVSWIENIPEAGRPLLRKLEGLSVALGAGRNHGLGQASAELRFETPESDEPAGVSVRALSEAVDQEARSLALRAKLDLSALPAGTLYLALVAQSDYVPASDGAHHPLAERVFGERFGSISLVRCFLSAGAAGGFDERPNRLGPLKDLLPAIGAGSVFVYEIENEMFAGIEDVLAILRRGVGLRVECGCGRFSLHPGTGLEGATV